jgi:predicted DNA-binding protein (MmcQ/YjbR family)
VLALSAISASLNKEQKRNHTMDYQKIRHYLLSKPAALEDFPFGPDVMVFKVKAKMFATLALGNDKQHYWMNLKCDPQQALILREVFDSVVAGYHMNKQHWNTVILDGSIPVPEIERMIDHSYTLVVKGLKKSDRLSLEMHYSKDELYC